MSSFEGQLYNGVHTVPHFRYGQQLCLEAWYINANSCALTREYGSYLPQETLKCFYLPQETLKCLNKDVAHVKKQSSNAMCRILL